MKNNKIIFTSSIIITSNHELGGLLVKLVNGCKSNIDGTSCPIGILPCPFKTPLKIISCTDITKDDWKRHIRRYTY